jgi:hypothetical protein
MSTKAKDSHGEQKNEARPAAATTPPPAPAGRIVHDSRGHAVWNWAPGKEPCSTETTSKMLKALDLGNLRMEDEVPAAGSQPEASADKKKRRSGYGPGYNPYDRTSPVRVTPPKKGSK